MNQPTSTAEPAALLLEAQRLIAQALALMEPNPSKHPSLARRGAPAPQQRSTAQSMTVEDIDETALEDAVARRGDTFDTWDVIEDQAFRAAHSQLLELPAFNQLVGKSLRRHHASLGIDFQGQRGRRRSARWHKR